MHRMSRSSTTDNQAFAEEGIIYSVQSGPQTKVTVAALRQQTEALMSAARQAGQPVLLLADLRAVTKTDSGARLEAKSFLDGDFDALAVAGNAYLQPIIMYVLKITGKQAKVHYFGSRTQALAWLRQPVRKGGTVPSNRPDRRSWFYWASACMVLLSVAASIVLWRQVLDQVEANSRKLLQDQTAQSQELIADAMHSYVDIMQGYQGLFQSSEQVTEGEFNAYYQSLDLENEHPGFSDLNFAARVPLSQRDAYVQRMRQDTTLHPQGNPTFAIVPAGDRPEYFVRTYVSQESGGKGLDIRVNDTRRQVLEAARDSGKPLATGSVGLLDNSAMETDNKGFLLTLPVYKQVNPPTVAERRATHLGFINALFDYDILFSSTLGQRLSGDARLTVRDAEGEVIYQSGKVPAPNDSQTILLPLEVAGQKWQVQMVSSKFFGLSQAEASVPRVVLLSGLLLSTLLAILLWFQLRAQRRAVSLAEAMTEDLQSERNAAVATKNKDEAILASIGDGVFALDNQGRVILFNKAAEKISGFGAADVVGKNYKDVLHFRDENSHQPSDQFIATAQAGQLTAMAQHTVLLRHSGELLPVADSAAPIFDADGQQQGVIVVFRDISGERQQQARLAQLAAIVESSDDAIISTDRQGTIMSWNSGAEQLFGYPARTAVGKTLDQLFGVKAAQPLRQALATAVESGEVGHFDTIYTTPRGRQLTTSIVVSQFKDREEQVAGLSWIARDTTLEKQFERALQESNERFELVAKATSEVVYDLTLPIDRLWWNDTLFSQYGYPKDEPAGSTEWWTAHIHPDDAMNVNEELTKHLASNDHTWTIEYRFQKADGSYVFVRDRAFVQRDKQGQPRRLVGSLLDITKQKELDRAKDEFISLVSHQLRTPLTAIRLYTEMLADGQVGKLQATQQDYLEKIDVSTKRMIQLVGDILNISRIELGRLKIEPKPTNVAALIRSHIDEVRPLADAKGVKLHFTEPGKLPSVAIDPILFGQTIHNLLTNAIRYSRAGGGAITIGFGKVKDGYELQVSDNGIGIPESAKPRIFERFFRADNAISVEGEGTGLGLYLIRMIMQQSGGNVRFESTEGKGTIFYVTMPSGGMKTKQGDRSLS